MKDAGYDINPMAYWIVRQEIEHLNLDAYIRAAEKLRKFLEKEIGSLYRTKCIKCGSKDTHAKYFRAIYVRQGLDEAFLLFDQFVET